MRSQAIEDLLWVLQSPPLIVGANVVEPITVDADAIDAAELTEFLAMRPGHRVGKYFENLVLFWLERIRKVEIVATNIQIQDGTRTLGEIDFLFRDEQGNLNHWEASVKFFLHFPNDNGSHYPGPNASDNFERKITKLLERQLPISEIHYPDVTVRRAFVRGKLFYHSQIEQPSVLPDHMNPAHLRGRWIRQTELEALAQYKNATGHILWKPLWLTAPVTGDGSTIEELIGSLRDHFAKSAYPVLISITQPGNTAAAEIERLFVVPSSWPQTKP